MTSAMDIENIAAELRGLQHKLKAEEQASDAERDVARTAQFRTLGNQVARAAEIAENIEDSSRNPDRETKV